MEPLLGQTLTDFRQRLVAKAGPSQQVLLRALQQFTDRGDPDHST